MVYHVEIAPSKMRMSCIFEDGADFATIGCGCERWF